MRSKIVDMLSYISESAEAFKWVYLIGGTQSGGVFLFYHSPGLCWKTVPVEWRFLAKFIKFHLGGQTFGMDVLMIQEILLADEIRIFDVPNAPEFLTGIINLRGILAPIVNLGIKIGCPAGAITDRSRVIICKAGPAGAVGVLVDELAELVETDTHSPGGFSFAKEKTGKDDGNPGDTQALMSVITLNDILGGECADG